MMNTEKIFKGSWGLMLRYKALWIFGVILALTTISFGSALWLRESDNHSDRTLVNWEISTTDKAWIKENFGFDLPLNYTLTVEDLRFRLDDSSISMVEGARLFNIVITMMAVLLTLLAVTLVLRYIAETALIKMVGEQQKSNELNSSREGWSFGFSYAALKLFLIDLVIFTLLLLLTPLLFLPALLPVFIMISGRPMAISFGLLLMTSLSLLSLAGMIVMWIAGLITVQLAYRASCLDGLGVFASIWRGFRLMRAQLGGVGLTWLVVVGLDLVYPLLVVPVGILLAAVGLVVGGGLALIFGSLLALVVAKTTAWTIAFIVGAVLLVLVIAVPLTLLGGLREVFKSSAWTLTFREAVRSQSIKSPSVPQSALQQMSTT
ncbi:MAG: hypothetical protein JSW42_10435 [Chloroflexota bacterium]|nr:MAG: hypothetical protein JSW42_10435 [Chloroflexota bacterium]